MDKKLKNTFFSLKDLPGIADSAILMWLECTINPQNFMKTVEAIFEKTIFLFFIMWTTLNFEGRSKTKTKKKNRQEIFTRGLQISNLNKIGQLV